MNYQEKLEELKSESSKRILNVFADFEDIYFFKAWGNIGDLLIYEGTKELISHIPYKEVDLRKYNNESGNIALISGSGGWTKHFHKLPSYLPTISKNFKRIIILPSTYDVNVPEIKKILTSIDALYFAREMTSFNQIKDICQADLALDCAFFYRFVDYYKFKGCGILNAFRQDAASIFQNLPIDNNDISTRCNTLDKWLEVIADHEIIRTDRAHVMIAAAMLGKIVEYAKTYDHKLPAIAAYALEGFPIYQIPDPFTSRFNLNKIFLAPNIVVKQSHVPEKENWNNVNNFARDLARKFETHLIIIENLEKNPVDSAILKNSIILIHNGLNQISENDTAAKYLQQLSESAEKIILVDSQTNFKNVDNTKSIIDIDNLPIEFSGTIKQDLDTPDFVTILSKSQPKSIQKPPASFRVVALLAIYNEVDIIEPVIEDLFQNNIDVYVIDNWSDDGTYELLTNINHQRLIGVERWPENGPDHCYDWTGLLKRKESLCLEIRAEWFIHLDADEIRESPWQDTNLRDAFWYVDQQGFNAIDFTVLNFFPVDNNFNSSKSPKEYFEFCQFGQKPGHFNQVKAWKNVGERVILAQTGGHKVQFSNIKIFPYKFLLRHYPLRTQQQGEKKLFIDRKLRFKPEELKKGWHNQYKDYSEETNFIRNPQELIHFPTNFYSNFLIERLSGIGIERLEPKSSNSKNTPNVRDKNNLQNNTNSENQLRRLRQINQKKTNEINHLQKEIASLTKEIETAQTDIVTLKQQVQFYTESKSWKITRPLRNIMDILRKHLK